MKSSRFPAPRWRQVQERFKKHQRRKRWLRKFPIVLLVPAVVCGAFVLFWLLGPSAVKETGRGRSDPSIEGDRLHIWPSELSRKELSGHLLAALNGSGAHASRVDFEENGNRFEIRTTIDEKLQKYVSRLIGWSRTHQTAVVVMNPYDGRILSMASRDSLGGGHDLCVRADFPAASLFKIVSASAALEAAGYSPDQQIFFVGSRYTLYRYQLNSSRGRNSVRTTLRKAFAVSNNAVFGKIGLYDLGPTLLMDFAHRFRFNQPIPFDLPVTASVAVVPTGEFGPAEMASGFNKETLVSPLHAALIASAVAADGRMAIPWLVAGISDHDSQVLYQARPAALDRPITRETALELKQMMQDGVRYGTTRTAFRQFRQSDKFKSMVFGSKTGTINDRRDRFKYDWIAAFALTPEPSDSICVAVLAVHGKLLGTRAVEMAGAIIRYYLLM